MKKYFFYTISKSIVKLSQELINEDESIEEIVVACDENIDRQFLLKKAASFIWGQAKQSSSDFQLPAPEKKR